jgi:Protein of unknown function (DUF2721)
MFQIAIKMNADTIAKTIQTIIAPVVMISACSSFLNSHQSRYGAITHRLREMVHERLLLLSGSNELSLVELEQLQQIDKQLPGLIRHHKGIHESVMIIYCAVILFIICMLAIAFDSFFKLFWLSQTSLILFLLGTIMLLIGVGQAALAFRNTHQGIHDEVRQTNRLYKSSDRSFSNSKIDRATDSII